MVEFSSGCREVVASIVGLETRVDNANLTNIGQYLEYLERGV